MRKRVDKRAAQANRRVLRAMGHRIKKRSRALTPFWVGDVSKSLWGCVWSILAREKSSARLRELKHRLEESPVSGQRFSRESGKFLMFFGHVFTTR